MAVKIEITDNIAKEMMRFQKNKDRALTAMGIEAAGGVKEYMMREKIRDTGTLMGSISSAQSGPDTVDVGTNVEYATFVHEGTSRMAGRPYLTNGINENLDRIKKVAEEALKSPF